jgi:hypothetical protein
LIREEEGKALYLMFNAADVAVDFALPILEGETHWQASIDTGREAPDDILAASEHVSLKDTQSYHLSPHSGAILLIHGRNES